MTGAKAGFVNLLTKEVCRTVIGFHCIIHEEALCANAGLKALQEVMRTVSNFVSRISARELYKTKFQVLLMEVQCVYKELKMYNDVRWLIRGLVLKRFVEYLNEICSFE